MKTTANISRPSYSQQAMRRHRAGVAPGAPACAGWTVRAGGAADIRATGGRLGGYWGATGGTGPGGGGGEGERFGGVGRDWGVTGELLGIPPRAVGAFGRGRTTQRWQRSRHGHG